MTEIVVKSRTKKSVLQDVHSGEAFESFLQSQKATPAKDGLSDVEWRVEGGFIVRYEPYSMEIWVVWDSEAPRHRIYASGLNASPKGPDVQGAGFDIKLDIDLQKQ